MAEKKKQYHTQPCYCLNCRALAAQREAKKKPKKK